MEILWKEQKLVLQLEHINGNHTDNRIENLIPLCPNCHSYFHIWRKKIVKKKIMLNREKNPSIGYKNIHETFNYL